MKRLISKKNKKEQIVSDEVWDNIVARGWEKRYTVVDMPKRPLRDVPEIVKPLSKPEVKTKTKKSNG